MANMVIDVRVSKDGGVINNNEFQTFQVGDRNVVDITSTLDKPTTAPH